VAAKSRLRSNSIRFREEDKRQENHIEEQPSTGRSKRSVVLQEQTRHKQTNEEKRKERQKELADQLNKEAKQRLLSSKMGSTEPQKYF
jgi:nucleosome binding factor SPN SPT16 subunit